MRKVTLTIDGNDYVALPRADYLRLVGKADEETVDALEFTLASLGHDLRVARELAGLTQAELAKEAEESSDHRESVRGRQDPRRSSLCREGTQSLRATRGLEGAEQATGVAYLRIGWTTC